MRTRSLFLPVTLCITMILAGCEAFAAQTLSGTVASVAADGGYLRMDTGDGVFVVEPANDIKIMRGQVGMDLRTVNLQELAPGDRVVAVIDQHGSATSLKAFFGIVKGTFLKNDGQKMIFADGRSVPLIAQTQIVTSDGKSAKPADIRKDSSLTCRINPISGQAWTVLVSAPSVKPVAPQVPLKAPAAPVKGSAEVKASPAPTPVVNRPQIKSITFSSPSLLKSGDLITVDITGTPGAKATFEIKNLVQQTPMKEVSSGVYHATVIVPKDKAAVGAALVGRMELNGAKAIPVQASRLVTVESAIAAAPATILIKAEPTDTSKPIQTQVPKPQPVQTTTAVTPAKIDVQLAKTERQVAAPVRQQVEAKLLSPAGRCDIVFTTPASGAAIQRTITVRGKAEPDEKLRVVVTYNNGLSGILKLSGEVASQLVATGGNGEFQMGPIPLEGSLATKGLEFTIKAYYPDRIDHGTTTLKVVGARG